MFCSQCGSSVNKDHKFCPFCGYLLTSPENDNVPPRRWRWGKILSVIALLAMVWVGYTFYNQEDYSDLLADQLIALKKNKLTEAYYNYTSKNFQEATDLEKFKSFISSYPVFVDATAAYFTLTDQEKNRLTFLGTFNNEQKDQLKVEYKLINEEGRWKIMSMRIVEDYSPPRPTVDDETLYTMRTIIDNQLQALRENNIKKAYYTYATPEFQTATSLEEFIAFVNNNPILTDHIETDVQDAALSGSFAKIGVTLLAPYQETLLEYKLKKEAVGWKVWNLNVLDDDRDEAIIAENDETANNTHREAVQSYSDKENAELMLPLVRGQFNALRDEDYDKAYSDYFTRDFKKSTSLEQFTKFIEGYKALFQGNGRLIEKRIDNGHGYVTMALNSPQGKGTVQYELAKEKGEWKIFGIELEGRIEKTPFMLSKEPLLTRTTANTSANNSPPNPQFDSQELEKPIRKLLSLLREGRKQQSYYELTSKQFREITPYSDYNEFIDKYPILSHAKNVRFDKLMIYNNIPTFSISLNNSSGDKATVEYDLIKEDQVWKILNMQITTLEMNRSDSGDNAATTRDKSMQFVNLLLGSAVDKEGYISNASNVLDPTIKDLYVNLYVRNGVAGEKVDLIFRHLDSDSTIPKIATTLQRNGDTVLSYVFSPPPKGWPTGNYEIEVSTTAGNIKRIFPFKIE